MNIAYIGSNAKFSEVLTCLPFILSYTFDETRNPAHIPIHPKNGDKKNLHPRTCCISKRTIFISKTLSKQYSISISDSKTLYIWSVFDSVALHLNRIVPLN